MAAYNENGIPFGIDNYTIKPELVHLYPNPAINYVNIEILYNIDILFVNIVTLHGKVIKEQVNQTGQKILLDLGNLPSGFYIIRTYTNIGVISNKLIIEK